MFFLPYLESRFDNLEPTMSVSDYILVSINKPPHLPPPSLHASELQVCPGAEVPRLMAYIRPRLSAELLIGDVLEVRALGHPVAKEG